jgi:hypothetical protein
MSRSTELSTSQQRRIGTEMNLKADQLEEAGAEVTKPSHAVLS